MLSDFFIGAHATARELPLLARDALRIRACFPTPALLVPGED